MSTIFEKFLDVVKELPW